jgi:hypothetical protein
LLEETNLCKRGNDFPRSWFVVTAHLDREHLFETNQILIVGECFGDGHDGFVMDGMNPWL